MGIRLKIKPAPAPVWQPLKTTERFMRQNYMYSLNAVTQWCEGGQIPEQSTIDGWVEEIFWSPIPCVNCNKDDAMCITCFWRQLNSKLLAWIAENGGCDVSNS